MFRKVHGSHPSDALSFDDVVSDDLLQVFKRERERERDSFTRSSCNVVERSAAMARGNKLKSMMKDSHFI